MGEAHVARWALWQFLSFIWSSLFCSTLSFLHLCWHTISITVYAKTLKRLKLCLSVYSCWHVIRIYVMFIASSESCLNNSGEKATSCLHDSKRLAELFVRWWLLAWMSDAFTRKYEYNYLAEMGENEVGKDSECRLRIRHTAVKRMTLFRVECIAAFACTEQCNLYASFALLNIARTTAACKVTHI